MESTHEAQSHVAVRCKYCSGKLATSEELLTGGVARRGGPAPDQNPRAVNPTRVDGRTHDDENGVWQAERIRPKQS